MSKCYGNSLVGTSGINGDSFYISPDNTVFMLSDGASGAGSEGKVIMSRTCAETIKNNPFSSSGLSAKDYLDKMVWQINNRLTEISQNRKSLVFGTLVICVVCDTLWTMQVTTPKRLASSLSKARQRTYPMKRFGVLLWIILPKSKTAAGIYVSKQSDKSEFTGVTYERNK